MTKETTYFIERTADNFWLEGAVSSVGEWTNDPHKALKFETEERAIKFINGFINYPMGPDDWTILWELKITEHQFVS